MTGGTRWRPIRHKAIYTSNELRASKRMVWGIIIREMRECSEGVGESWWLFAGSTGRN